MDKEIPQKERNQVKLWSIIKYFLVAGLLVLAFLALRKFLKRSGNIEDFHTAIVERGNIQNTLTASGVVKPAFEREVNAPVNTEIKSVAIPKGTVVKKGDLIMELDQEYTQLEYDRLYDELELKRNNIDKLKLQYDKDLKDMEYQDQIKALNLSELRAQVKDQERLVEIGGATNEELESAKLKLEVAEIEKLMLENNLEYTKSANVKEKRNLELEYEIQEKKLKELKRKLSETSVTAPLDGVITWINEDIGRTVNAGEPLVRIADLNRYIVEASSSDRNAEKINIGMPVNVRINRNNLPGLVSSVLPEVENNTVKFLIALEKEDAEVLRPNMRTEVYLITDEKVDILKIKNGSAFSGANTQDVYRIEGEKAVKVRIIKGLTNADFVEITSNNVSPGDRFIISETRDYDHLDEFNLKQ